MITAQDKFGLVVIGRNEGDRLKTCLSSLPAEARVVYVDSGSTDGSPEWANERGIECVKLDARLRFHGRTCRAIQALVGLQAKYRHPN